MQCTDFSARNSSASISVRINSVQSSAEQFGAGFRKFCVSNSFHYTTVQWIRNNELVIDFVHVSRET